MRVTEHVGGVECVLHGGVVFDDGHRVTFYSKAPGYKRIIPASLAYAKTVRDLHDASNPALFDVRCMVGEYIALSERPS